MEELFATPRRLVLHSVDNEQFIKNCVSSKEVYKEINKFIEDNNYTCYYIRSWDENDKTIYDFGSWHDFFYLYKESKKEKSEGSIPIEFINSKLDELYGIYGSKVYPIIRKLIELWENK